MTSRGKPIRYIAGAPQGGIEPARALNIRLQLLRFSLGLEHGPALVHAGLEVDVVRTAELAGVLVLNVGRLLKRVGRTAHAAAGGRGFSFRNSHGGLLHGARAPEAAGRSN